MINTVCTYWNGKFVAKVKANAGKREKEGRGGVICRYSTGQQ